MLIFCHYFCCHSCILYTIWPHLFNILTEIYLFIKFIVLDKGEHHFPSCNIIYTFLFIDDIVRPIHMSIILIKDLEAIIELVDVEESCRGLGGGHHFGAIRTNLSLLSFVSSCTVHLTNQNNQIFHHRICSFQCKHHCCI